MRKLNADVNQRAYDCEGDQNCAKGKGKEGGKCAKGAMPWADEAMGKGGEKSLVSPQQEIAADNKSKYYNKYMPYGAKL